MTSQQSEPLPLSVTPAPPATLSPGVIECPPTGRKEGGASREQWSPAIWSPSNRDRALRQCGPGVCRGHLPLAKNRHAPPHPRRWVTGRATIFGGRDRGAPPPRQWRSLGAQKQETVGDPLVARVSQHFLGQHFPITPFPQTHKGQSLGVSACPTRRGTRLCAPACLCTPPTPPSVRDHTVWG